MRVNDIKRDYATINMREFGSDLLKSPNHDQQKIKKDTESGNSDLNFHDLYLQEISKPL